MSTGVRHWGDGPREVVMLHCALAQASAWKRVATALAEGLHITAPDMVGHGAGPEYDPARDLHDQSYEAVLRQLPDGQFDAIGHSFGATLALRLAIEMPARIRSLVMIEPVLFAAAKGSGRYSPHLAASEALGIAGKAQDKITAAREFLKLWGSGEEFDSLPEAQRAYMADRIHLIDASEAALFEDSAGLVPRLGQVIAPTLLIAGGDCLPVTSAILDRMEQDIAQTARVSIPGAGHMAPITHPDPVAEAIAAHFAHM